jgi:hypothetical protein
MAHAFRHDKALAWQKINCTIFKIDQETSVEDEKEFVDVLVLVPMVLALHYRHPDDRIVHLAQRLVVPFVRAGIGEFLHIDQFERAMQKVEAGLVRKIFRRFDRFHGQNLTAEIAWVAEKTKNYLSDLCVLSGERNLFFPVKITPFLTLYDDAILC